MPRPKFQCRTSLDTIVSVERFKAWFFVNRTQPCSQSTTLKFGAGAKSRMLVCNGGVPQPCRIFGWKTNVYIHIMCIQTGQKLNHNSRVKNMDFALARPCKMTSNASSEIHWFSMVCFQKPFFFHVFMFLRLYCFMLSFSAGFFIRMRRHIQFIAPNFSVGHNRVQLFRLRAWFLCAAGPTMQPKHSIEIWGGVGGKNSHATVSLHGQTYL